MNNKKLTFKINERDAVLVRAIPYVTSRGVFHPNVVVANLARSIRTLKVYRIPFNTPIQIKPIEWRNLNKRTKEQLLRYENNTIGAAAWIPEFVALLPAKAFVWLDDLENIWKNGDFINDTRPVNPDLTLIPALDADVMAMVIMNDVVYKNIGKCLDDYWEKPWSELPEEQRRAWHEALDLIGGNDEMDSKHWEWVDKKRLAWNHDYYHDPAFENERFVIRHDISMDTKTWLDLENVTPKEAAMLLCRLNPHHNEDPERIYVDDDKTSPDRYCLLLRVFEDRASVSQEFRTLMQWRSIAQERGLRYHSWIDEYVQAAGVADDASAVATAATIKTELSKAWLIVDPKDPKPEHIWYAPARYFARQLVVDNPILATKRNLLAMKVVPLLTSVGIKKRGGIKPFDPGTILKAFNNIDFG